MTRFFDATFEGASLTGTNGGSSVTGTVTLDSTSKVKGTYSSLHNTAASFVRFDFTASSTVYVSAYLYVTSFANNIRTFYITNICRIDIRSNGALRLADNAGTQIGSDSSILSTNTLYRIGIKYVAGTGSNAIIEAYVATGDNNFGTAFAATSTDSHTGTANRLDVGNTAGATTNTFYVDDIRIDDSAMPGPSVSSTQVDTSFTAAASFATLVDKTFTASASFYKEVDKTFTAAASFAVLVDKTFTAAASFSAQVDKTFTASASFQLQPETSFTAAASFQGTISTSFTAAASFASVEDKTFTASASFSLTSDKTFTASASFQATVSTNFAASASFRTLYIDTSFTVAASFRSIAPISISFTASASFSISEDVAYTAPQYWPYPESFEPIYEVRLASPDGEYIDVLDHYSDLSYSLVINDAGSLTISLPPNYPLSMIQKDARIEVWRGVGFSGLKLEGETQFLIQGRERAVDDSGNRTLKVMGMSLNHLLKRRVVPYQADNLTYTELTDYADDMMKTIIRTNFINLATDSARQIDSRYLTVDSDISAGPMIAKTFAHKNVYDVLKEIADTSYQQGTALFFDVVVDYPPRKHVFRTWTTARGADRRYTYNRSSLILGFNYGSIGAYTITEDWSNEISYVYVGGPGEDDVRDTQVAEDTLLTGSGPYGRRELWQDFQDGDTAEKLLSEARAQLSANRPRKFFQGTLQSVPQALYGVHWYWGDFVTADAEDDQFDCFVSAVQVNVGNDGKEAIQASLRSDE